MICRLCPRQCGAERTAQTGPGRCRMPAGLRVARAGLHHWEEPVISGSRGSGAVFFSGCSLGCVYCQNGRISHGGFGKEITTQRLREIFEELIAQGAHNINLVSGDHFLPWILPALEPRLPVPVVWNCSGYQSQETLDMLRGKVDIYLPDLKYADTALAGTLSDAPDYFPIAARAIREMFDQVGPCFLSDGLLQKGVVIRHLLLPGCLDNTKRCIDYVAENFAPGQVLFSLMSQYTPQPGAQGQLARRVRRGEYRAAMNYAQDCGITQGFFQEPDSAQSEYTPDFDLTGV